MSFASNDVGGVWIRCSPVSLVSVDEVLEPHNVIRVPLCSDSLSGLARCR